MAMIVCPDCNGHGVRDIKSDGWTQSDIEEYEYDEQEDFGSAYMSGKLSETCRTCNGRNVVDENYEEFVCDCGDEDCNANGFCLNEG